MSRPYRKRAVLSVRRTYSRDPLDRVDSISGVNSDHSRWTMTQAAAIAAMEAGSDEFFVKADTAIVKLVVFNRGGEKYLQTEREKTHPDDLINLTFGQGVTARVEA